MSKPEFASTSVHVPDPLVAVAGHDRAVPNVFVSYSRRDFYAAEALTSVLAASGEVRTWLDVEHLRPGTDWSAAINGAIESADAMVVVASPAAMASRWVTEEWQRALRAGKQVHVALVRGTDLPPELAAAVVHDLRGRVLTETRRLVDVLMGRAAPRARRRVPVSGPMSLLWSALVFCTLIAGVGATLGWDLSQVYQPVHTGMARLGLALALLNVVGAAGLIYVMIRLTRRSVSPWSLNEGLAVGLAVALFSLLGTLMVNNRSYQDAAGPDARTDSAWLYLTAAAVAGLGLVLVRVSRTVHLEMPTGAGEAHVRGRLKGQRVSRRRSRRFAHDWDVYQPKLAALKAAMPAAGSTATYRVWCHPDDAPCAKLLTHSCDLAGFVQDEVDPRWVFVVVSTRTPEEIIRNALEIFGYRVVFVLTTSLRLPEEDELRRHQWLDFREQEPEGLYAFLLTTVTAGQAERGVVTVPTGVDTFRAPRYVTGYLLFGRVMVGLVAAPVLGLLVAGTLARAVPLALVTGALVLAVINLTHRTAARSIDEVGWLGRSVLVFLLFAAWVVLAPNIPNIPPVNRVAVGIFVVLGMFRPAKTLLGLWLPPARKGPLPKPAAEPVAPPAYAFSLPLASLVFATGYFNFADA